MTNLADAQGAKVPGTQYFIYPDNQKIKFAMLTYTSEYYPDVESSL